MGQFPEIRTRPGFSHTTGARSYGITSARSSRPISSWSRPRPTASCSFWCSSPTIGDASGRSRSPLLLQLGKTRGVGAYDEARFFEPCVGWRAHLRERRILIHLVLFNAGRLVGKDPDPDVGTILRGDLAALCRACHPGVRNKLREDA